VHTKSAAPFLSSSTKNVNMETSLELKKHMIFRKKSKLLVVAAAVVALLVIVVPYVAYALPVEDSSIAASRTLEAKGIAREAVNGEKVNFPASLTLTLTYATDNNKVPKFEVTDGSIIVDGVTYTITSGNGGVLRGRHLIVLQGQGTDSEGQAVTLRIAGRYFWVGDHIYVVRLGAKLQTNNAEFTLQLRAQIQV
jgi:hypothetical protein